MAEHDSQHGLAPRRKLAKLALIATLLASVVVVLGAYTRLVDAGLGCPDWPGCYGQLTVPNTAEEISAAEALFPHAPVETFKGWAEMVHRYFAGALLLFIFYIALYTYRQRRAGLPYKHAAALLVLVICQAAFGMWTVTLKLWPQVVTLHLMGGFATLSLLFLLTLRLYDIRLPRLTAPSAMPRLRKLAVVGLVLVCMQIVLGGWVSSNYAAFACPELPTCQQQWLPQADYAQGFNIFQEIGPNYLGGQMDNDARVAIHFSHRVGAIVVTVALLTLIVVGWRQRAMRPTLGLVATALAVQVALGLSNIIWHIPLAVAVAHNAGGAVLLLTLVLLNYQLQRQVQEAEAYVPGDHAVSRQSQLA